MKSLFVLALALVACQALDLETEWEAFKVKHGKTYLSATHVSTDPDPNTGKSRRSPIFRYSSEFRYWQIP